MCEDVLAALAEDPAWHTQPAPGMVSLEALRGCLGKLADASRTVVDLRYKDNQSCESIAKKLQRPLESIYVTLSRTRQQLRECVRRQLSTRGSA